MRLSARNGIRYVAALGVTALLSSAPAPIALEARKEFRLDIAAGGAVTLTNSAGSVSLKASTGHQVIRRLYGAEQQS